MSDVKDAPIRESLYNQALRGIWLATKVFGAVAALGFLYEGTQLYRESLRMQHQELVIRSQAHALYLHQARSQMQEQGWDAEQIDLLLEAEFSKQPPDLSVPISGLREERLENTAETK